MIDSEVTRLRRLRNTALGVRALTRALHSTDSREAALLARASRTAWTIARTVSGRLLGHPHLSYQQPPGALRLAAIHYSTHARAAWLSPRGRAAETAVGALQRLGRALDDARALTWSSDLGDAFGRSQHQLRRLTAELGRDLPGKAAQASAAVATLGGANSEDSWPYLAF